MPDFEIKLRFLTNQRRRRGADVGGGVGGFGVEVDLVMNTSVEPESDIESETLLELIRKNFMNLIKKMLTFH